MQAGRQRQLQCVGLPLAAQQAAAGLLSLCLFVSLCVRVRACACVRVDVSFQGFNRLYVYCFNVYLFY